MALHHYVLVECENATFKIEMLKEGLCVEAITRGLYNGYTSDTPAVANEMPSGCGSPASCDMLDFIYRRQRLTRTMPGQPHAEAGQEVQHVDLKGYATVELLMLWVAGHANDRYCLLEWNCQHFVAGLMAVCELAECAAKREAEREVTRRQGEQGVLHISRAPAPY